jgi:hypothetical protein
MTAEEDSDELPSIFISLLAAHGFRIVHYEDVPITSREAGRFMVRTIEDIKFAAREQARADRIAREQARADRIVKRRSRLRIVKPPDSAA